uniref:Hva1_TUDOR domain-containing protein n=1 Tax=Strongyloides venezuelensis TaxID=75913 RepID=A0A0K0F5P7_STRVS
MDIFIFLISILLLFLVLCAYTPFHEIIFGKKDIKAKKKKSNREVLIDNEHLAPPVKIVPKFKAAKPNNIAKLSTSVPWHPEGKPKKEKYRIYIHKNGALIDNDKYDRKRKNIDKQKPKDNQSKFTEIKVVKVN